MLSPYGMEIVESCLTCKLRADRIFCDLPPTALQNFENIKFATAYPQGAVLFVEGQMPRGIFVLCKGGVKLSINSPSGRTMIVKLAEPGEVLGLSATISGKPYEVTAETIDPCQVNFVKREDFLKFLERRCRGLLQGGGAVGRKVSQCLQGSARRWDCRTPPPRNWPSCFWNGAPRTEKARKAEPRLKLQTHPRGNRADDRDFARDGYPAVCGVEEASDIAVERLDSGHSQYVSAARDRESQLGAHALARSLRKMSAAGNANYHILDIV